MTQVYTVWLSSQNAKKKWKARWFVLGEDQLCCYHKHNKSVLINSLPLVGCAVTSPCNDLTDTNPQVSPWCFPRWLPSSAALVRGAINLLQCVMICLCGVYNLLGLINTNNSISAVFWCMINIIIVINFLYCCFDLCCKFLCYIFMFTCNVSINYHLCNLQL